MKTTTNKFADRFISAVASAIMGAFIWIVLVFMVRWPLLFTFVFFGIDWAPAFFGWGFMMFAGVAAVIGFLVAD